MFVHLRRPLVLVILAAACVTRLNNAFRYPPFHGFDAEGNWRYIQQLTRSWALPAPEAGWSTAHPPLFYYSAAALLRALRSVGVGHEMAAVRLLVAAAGLGIAVLAVWLVRRTDPARPGRALLAGAVVAMVPAHVYASAMVSEEILVAFLASLAIVGVALPAPHAERGAADLRRPAGVGLAAGLAWLAKLSGVLAAVVAAATYALEALRRRALGAGLRRVAVVGVVALAVGGWYYGRNLVEHGYLYPHALPQHAHVMFQMPPGERSPADYVRLPLATFTDPQLLNPDLLRSVWGSTYATLWFDGHRHFLPVSGRGLPVVAALLLLLGLLPTVAFLLGLARGVRRALGDPRSADVPLLLMVGLSLAGYVLFTWRNPWFAAVKGSYLLGLSVPFGYYASEILSEWLRGPRWRRVGVACALLVLAGLVTTTFSYGLVWESPGLPGLPWEAPSG